VHLKHFSFFTQPLSLPGLTGKRQRPARGVVSALHCPGANMLSDYLHRRRHQCHDAAHPVRRSGVVEIDTLVRAGINFLASTRPIRSLPHVK